MVRSLHWALWVLVLPSCEAQPVGVVSHPPADAHPSGTLLGDASSGSEDDSGPGRPAEGPQASLPTPPSADSGLGPTPITACGPHEPRPSLPRVEGVGPKPGTLLAILACENTNYDWKRVEGSERPISFPLPPDAEQGPEPYATSFVTCRVDRDDRVTCHELGEDPVLTAEGQRPVVDIGIGSGEFASVALLYDDGTLEIEGETVPGVFVQVEGTFAIDEFGRLCRWSREGEMLRVSAGPEGVYRQVSQFDGGYCTLGWEGDVRCWDDREAPLGPSPLGPFEQLSASQQGVCAIGANATAVCWGHDHIDVEGLDTFPAIEVDLAERGLCARAPDGSVTCWPPAEGAPAMECPPFAPAR